MTTGTGRLPEDQAAAQLAADVTWEHFTHAADPDDRLAADKRRRDAETIRHAFLCRMVLRRAEIRSAAKALQQLVTAYEADEQAARAGTWEPPGPQPRPGFRRAGRVQLNRTR